MEIECEIDFSEAYYQEYDQELIDLFYFWNKDNKIIQFRKNHWVYTFVTLLYSGVPEELPNNKTISIKGNNISTKYGFFNEFAEKYIGEKAYIGNGLDSLIDSFRQSKIDKNYNKNIINISNYELLEEKMNFYNIGYLDEIISVLIDFGFNVNKM